MDNANFAAKIADKFIVHHFILLTRSTQNGTPVVTAGGSMKGSFGSGVPFWIGMVAVSFLSEFNRPLVRGLLIVPKRAKRVASRRVVDLRY